MPQGEFLDRFFAIADKEVPHNDTFWCALYGIIVALAVVAVHC